MEKTMRAMVLDKFGGAEQADAIAPQDDAAAKVAAESGAEAGADCTA